jgi:hypothetical protein
MFERLFRIQMNSLEQLIVLLPGLYLYASYFSPFVAAAPGVSYPLGRELYAFTYARDPASLRRIWLDLPSHGDLGHPRPGWSGPAPILYIGACLSKFRGREELLGRLLAAANQRSE